MEIKVRCSLCEEYFDNYSPCYFSGYIDSDAGIHTEKVICVKCIKKVEEDA